MRCKSCDHDKFLKVGYGKYMCLYCKTVDKTYSDKLMLGVGLGDLEQIIDKLYSTRRIEHE